VSKRILIFAGLALYMLTLVLGYYSSSDLIALTAASPSERVVFHLLVSGAEVLTLFALSLMFRRDDRRFLEHPMHISFVTAALGVSAFAFLAFSQQLADPLPALVGAALTLGCTLSLLFVFWCSQLVRFSYRGSYLIVIGTHGMATACDAAYLSLPVRFDGATMLVTLLLSCLCMALLAKTARSARLAKTAHGEGGTRNTEHTSVREATPLLRNGVLAVCVFAFISGLTLSNTGGAVSDPFTLQGFMLGASAAVLLIMLIPVLVTHKPLKLENSYRVALPLSTLGFIVVPFLVSELPTGISGILVTTGYMLTGIVLYCTVAEASRITGAPILPLLAGCEAITLTCYIVGSTVSYPLSGFISGAWGNGAIIGLALLYLALFFLGPRLNRNMSHGLAENEYLTRVANGTPAVGSNTLLSFEPADIGLLSVSRGLNERETEILVLMAEGRTLSRIGEEMGLSTSGIKYHAHSLYRKLGVNSRDELLSLAAANRGGSGSTLEEARLSLDALTVREQEVAQMLAHGKTIEAIAQELIISTNTAKTHTRTIYSKLGVHSKQELIDLVRG
jgi:DNA-binding NarL/FixJ family response regulator